MFGKLSGVIQLDFGLLTCSFHRQTLIVLSSLIRLVFGPRRLLRIHGNGDMQRDPAPSVLLTEPAFRELRKGR